MKLTLKTMLKSTVACILLTLVWYFFTRTRPRVDFFAEFELIALWGALLVGWVLYLAAKFRNRRNERE